MTLGTDGFGRSDYRVKLRKFFEVNRYYVAVAALKALADDGEIKADVVEQAITEVRTRHRAARSLDRMKPRRIHKSEGSHMAAVIEVKVPDIGDFKDVPVIEVMVKPGDTREGRRTRWSRSSRTRRRWTCRRRSPGTVKDVKVKVGDKVSEGSVILLLDPARAPARRRRRAPQDRGVRAAVADERARPASPKCACPTSATSRTCR